MSQYSIFFYLSQRIFQENAAVSRTAPATENQLSHAILSQ